MHLQSLVANAITLALAAGTHALQAGEAGAKDPRAPAIVYCAHDVAGLVFSLAVADDNGLDDDIRLVAGTYQPSIIFSAIVQESSYLKISGGWNADCSQQNGGQTVLDGQGQTSLLKLASQQATDFTVSDITFVNGFSDGEHESALQILTVFGIARAERNIIFANQSIGQSVGAMDMYGFQALALNNLVVGNDSTGFALGVRHSNDPGSLLMAAGNTVLNNTVNTSLGNAGMYVYSVGGNAYVANNLLWGNSGSDLYLYSQNGAFSTLVDNDVGVLHGFAPGPDSSGNFSAAPVFAPGLLNFRLASKSPTINRGGCVIGDSFCAPLGETDLGDGPRIQGARPDIGAYESDVLLFGGFESMP